MWNRRRTILHLTAPAAAIPVAAAMLVAAPAHADFADLDLRDDYGLRMESSRRDRNTVAGAGDFNADGYQDILLSPHGGTRAHLVLGGASGAIDLDSLGDLGLSIQGQDLLSAAGTGDVNGDGYDDVVIGWGGACDFFADPPYTSTGTAHVVLGGSTDSVEYAELDSRGYRIDMISTCGDAHGTGDTESVSVAGAGDVNGDGYDDVLIGVPGADDNGRNNSGSVFVVFGGSTADVGLAALGARGFRIDGASENDEAGRAVAGAGDVNGDGFDDVLVGVPGADDNGRNNSGSVFVVFGGSTADVDLAALDSRGFRIDGSAAGHGLGYAITGAGDVDGDGYDDVLIGVRREDRNGRDNSGSSYVVLGGGTASVDLADPGDRSFRIDGAVKYNGSGAAVAGGGDVNGDGYPDLVIGAPRANNNEPKKSGSTYVVFGGTTENLDLRALGDRGFRIDGSSAFGQSGTSVGNSGDVNADGYDDVLVADDALNDPPGAAHVVFGRPTATLVVKARGEARKVKRTGRTTLVRSVRVGKGQKARVSVKVLPKKARKTVSVKKTTRRVEVRTRKTPKTARIRVRVSSRGPGYLTGTWARTWRMVGAPRREPQTAAPLLLALGDSWAGGQLDRRWYGYVNRLLDDLRLQGTCPGSAGARCEDLQVRNMAQGNATTASMIRERLQDAVDLLRQRNGDTDPGNDVVVTVVTVGGLDAFQPILTSCAGGLGDSCRATIEQVFTTYETNMARILGALRGAAGEDAEIVVTAYDNPIPHCYVGGMGLGPLAAAVVEGDAGLGVPAGLNDITRRVAAEHSVKVAETYGRLKAGDWVGGTDCVHPDASGHEKIAAAFAKALRLKTTRPGAVRVLKQVIKGGKARLTWRAARRAKRYQVRISDPGGTTYRKWTRQKKRTLVRTVRRGKTYRAQIRALGPGGRGPITTITLKRT